MLHNIYKNNFASAGSDVAYFNRQDINALGIFLDRAPRSDDYLQVTLKSEFHSPKTLITRIPMLALADVSDLERGASQVLQGELQGLTDASVTDYLNYPFGVDTGNMKMQATQSSLELNFELGAAANFSIFGVNDDDDTDSMCSWKRVSQLTDRVADCEAIYLYRKTAAIQTITSEDLSVQIDSKDGSFTCVAEDLYAYSGAFMNVEAQSPQQVVCAYKASDGLLDTVQYNITGANASDYDLILKTRRRDPVRVSRGNMFATDRAISILERQDAYKRRALKRAGVVPGLRALRAGRRIMNTGDKAPGGYANSLAHRG